MTPPEAKEHAQAFAKAVRSIEKLPKDHRMPNSNPSSLVPLFPRPLPA